MISNAIISDGEQSKFRSRVRPWHLMDMVYFERVGFVRSLPDLHLW